MQQAAAIVAPRAAATDEACDRADQTTSARSAGRATRSGTRRPRLRMPGGWPRGFPCATPANRPRASRAKPEGISTMAQARHPTGINRQGAPGRPLSYPPRAEGTQKVSAAGVAGNRTVAVPGCGRLVTQKPCFVPVVLNGSEGSKTGPSTLPRLGQLLTAGRRSGCAKSPVRGEADQLSYSVQWPARRQKGVIC